MFALSKVLGFFLLPSNLLFLLALVGILLMRSRWRRFGQGMTIGSVLLLVVVGLGPVGNALMLPLEERFPQWKPGPTPPQGIVVLGGALSPDVSAVRGQPALNEAAERMTVVAKLARDFPSARIVFTGGSGRLMQGASEADFVADLFASFGIANERLLLEGRSRNTVENALYTGDLVKPKPEEVWLLVTSAHHMPRAIGIFRKAGFPVEAYPVDFRTRGESDLAGYFHSVSAGLARTDTAIHEWAGLAMAWLLGHSQDLFPALVPH